MDRVISCSLEDEDEDADPKLLPSIPPLELDPEGEDAETDRVGVLGLGRFGSRILGSRSGVRGSPHTLAWVVSALSERTPMPEKRGQARLCDSQ